MSTTDDARRAADAADQWLRTGKPDQPGRVPEPIHIGRHTAYRAARQHTTLELLSRIDDLKAEVRWERERADRLEVDLALAKSALSLTRREETLRLRDRAGLAAYALLVAIGIWANLLVITQ